MASSIPYLAIEMIKGDTFSFEFYLDDEDGNVESAVGKSALLEMYDVPDGPVVASLTNDSDTGVGGHYVFATDFATTAAYDFTERLYDMQIIDTNYTPNRKETVFQGIITLVRRGS